MLQKFHVTITIEIDTENKLIGKRLTETGVLQLLKKQLKDYAEIKGSNIVEKLNPKL